MTSRERVKRAFERRDQDRAPRYESFWSETIRRWMSEGLPGTTEWEARAAALELLESDLHVCAYLCPQPFGARSEVLEENEETQVVKDASGGIARWWKNKDGTPEHIGFDCDSREKWDRIYKPAFQSHPLLLDVKAALRNYEEGRRRDKWTFITGVEPFEMLRKLLGDIQFLYATVDDPEWVVDLAETTTSAMLCELDAAFAAGIRPDSLWIYGDMAFKNMTFCSPDTYRELIWPQHKRMADWAHGHGMKFIYHTDGDVRAVIPLYIEAGFDCLQPLEAKASMDLRDIAPRYGDKLALFGNIDVMSMLRNDLPEIEAEIAAKTAAGLATRGYIFHSDHSIPPQVSFETFKAMIALADRYTTF